MNGKFMGGILLVLAVAFLPTAYADVCGNNICESSEDSCSCPDDCKGCSGPIEGQVCKSYGCMGKGCTIVTTPSCCGNGICEPEGELSENYGSCPSDCKPKELDINISSPMHDENVLIGENVEIILSITSAGSQIAGADVLTYILGKRIDIVNDGQHNDGSNFDNIYGGMFIVPDINGELTFDINTSFRNVKVSKRVTINVRPEMSGVIQLPEELNLGRELKLSGKINKLDDGEKLPIKVALKKSEEVIADINAESDETGNFNVSYKTDLSEPLGEWTINITTEDKHGNKFDEKYSLPVEKQSFEDTLKIRLAKEIGKEHQRGEQIEFTLNVFDEENNVVEGAVVNIVGQAKDSVKMTENPKGTYTGFYFLKYDLSAGSYKIEIKAKKIGEKAIYEGKKEIEIEVKPGELEIEVIEPSEKEFVGGENAIVKIKARYSRGEVVETATVTGRVEDKLFNFREDTSGVYLVNYVMPEEPEHKVIEVEIKDQYGNLGKKSITILRKGAGEGINFGNFGLIIFIIIGIVVLALLGGVVYVIKNRQGKEKGKQIEAKETTKKEKSHKEESETIVNYYESEDEIKEEHIEQRQEVEDDDILKPES